MRLETGRRIEEERRKQQEIDEAMAASKRRIDVQTSVPRLLQTKTVRSIVIKENHCNTQDLGIDDTREMTERGVLKAKAHEVLRRKSNAK